MITRLEVATEAGKTSDDTVSVTMTASEARWLLRYLRYTRPTWTIVNTETEHGELLATVAAVLRALRSVVSER